MTRERTHPAEKRLQRWIVAHRAMVIVHLFAAAFFAFMVPRIWTANQSFLTSIGPIATQATSPVALNWPVWFVVAMVCMNLLLAVNQFLQIRRVTVKLRELVGQCRECGYSLRELIEPRCPECGTAFDHSVFSEQPREPAEGE